VAEETEATVVGNTQMSEKKKKILLQMMMF
jgi:hypothetical protein